jgi:hypothetical protein
MEQPLSRKQPRFEGKSRREGDSRDHPVELGFKPAWWFSFALGCLGLATRASDLARMIGEAQLAPFVTVACFLGAIFWLLYRTHRSGATAD